jgi:hypothetical protein
MCWYCLYFRSIGTRIEHMFEWFPSPVEVTVSAVTSTRDGWHPTVSIDLQDRALRAVDPARLDADEALSALVALQEHRARLDALEVTLLVRAAGATQVVRNVLVEPGAGATCEQPRHLQLTDEVLDEIACALRRPISTVHRQVHHARLLRGPLARTQAELAAGRITLQHAHAVAEQADRMTCAIAATESGGDADESVASACERLQDRVLPHALTETPAQTRTRARRAVVAVDPTGERERRQLARRGCDVTGYGIGDGLAVIEARLPVSMAAWVVATVRARASVHDGSTSDPQWRARHGIDEDATLGQLRAAAFVDLMRAHLVEATSPATSASAHLNVEVQVLVDAATLVGLQADGTAWVQVGTGAWESLGREELVRLVCDPLNHATLRRLVTDPATGSLVDRGSRTYAVSPALARWIATRDQTCRFPGCTRRAARCDIDHAVEFADGGPTNVANTGALCRRHHNRKTHGDWTISDSQHDGACTFTSPAGRTYRHAPVELIPKHEINAPMPSANLPPPSPATKWSPGDPFPF